MLFTNPGKIKYTFTTTDKWAVIFDDNDFNLIESSTGIKIFPAADVSFKELSFSNLELAVGVGGHLDLSAPRAVNRPTKIELSFVDDVDNTINTLIRDWIFSSPVYTQSRVLNIQSSSDYTKSVTIFKLDQYGEKISSYGKINFTVFPSEEIVNAYNSSPETRLDKLSLRAY